jgi:molecular chaperone GrpE
MNPSETDADTDEDSDNALAAAKSEAEKYRDMALRAEAEMQNLRRRSERDVQNAHKFGAERLIQNLLPVVDSLEKAVEASQQAETAEDDPQLEGLKLCLKLFTDVLTKEGIEVVDPLGQPFDPNVHEALSMIENPDMEPNSVMAGHSERLSVTRTIGETCNGHGVQIPRWRLNVSEAALLRIQN